MNYITFDNPHPSDLKPESHLASDFLGKYYSCDSFYGEGKYLIYNSLYYLPKLNNYDSITIFSAKLIVTKELVTYSFNSTEYYKIDKSDTARLNKFYKYNMYIKDGFIIHEEKFSDTLLNLSGSDKLYLYDNKYYLNHFIQTGDGFLGIDTPVWEINQFERVDANSFSLNATDKYDCSILFDTTQFWKPIHYIAHITNKQFIDFIAKGGFHTKYKLLK